MGSRRSAAVGLSPWPRAKSGPRALLLERASRLLEANVTALALLSGHRGCLSLASRLEKSFDFRLAEPRERSRARARARDRLHLGDVQPVPVLQYLFYLKPLRAKRAVRRDTKRLPPSPPTTRTTTDETRRVAVHRILAVDADESPPRFKIAISTGQNCPFGGPR